MHLHTHEKYTFSSWLLSLCSVNFFFLLRRLHRGAPQLDSFVGGAAGKHGARTMPFGFQNFVLVLRKGIYNSSLPNVRVCAIDRLIKGARQQPPSIVGKIDAADLVTVGSQ